MAVQLEIDHLRADYTLWRQNMLPHDRVAGESERLHAADDAFAKVLEHITTRFPRANYHRDSILFELMTDLATTPEHARRIDELTYQYYVRHPEEQRPGDEHQYTATESVKNFLSMLQSREMRREVLSWLYGGTILDDRFLAGSTFHVNEQEKAELFWSLSSEERRAILYAALMGEHGLFDTMSFDPAHASAYPEHYELYKFLEDFYRNNFENLSGSARMKDALQIAFFTAFTHYSPARRIELFLAISDQMRKLRSHGEKLTMGNAVQLLLEHVGVIGVKAGQVLAEQKDLLPDEVRDDLSLLQDHAQPFGKQGVFTYFQLADLFRRDDHDREGSMVISEVGRLLGSASVKQVHLLTTPDGVELVGKVQRPTIDRNYKEDMMVLGAIVKTFQAKGYNVPDWFLPEIDRVVSAERDFGIEARAAMRMREQLRARSATIMFGDREIPLVVPEVKMILEKGQHRISNLQLTIEEFGRGLSLQDIMHLQRLEHVVDRTPRDQETAERLARRLQDTYGSHASILRDAFLRLNIEHIRGQVALQLLLQIGQDGIFHADLHSGNIIIDCAHGEESVRFIDCGAAGESVVTQGEQAGADHRMAFSQFTQDLLTVQGKRDVQQEETIARIAKTLKAFAPLGEYEAERGFDELLDQGPATISWDAIMQDVVARSTSPGELFTNILSESLKNEATIDPNFRYLLKALASAGGHFESLRRGLMKP